jgi:hypothetical protein
LKTAHQPTAGASSPDEEHTLTGHESMVADLLRGMRHARMTGLMAKLACVLEGDIELEIFVPCKGCSAPVELGGAPDGRCRDCRRAD